MLNSPTAVPRVIKRYSNRKLYDPQTSKYVTLDDLKQLIRDGTELRVEDAATGEDLTSLTLAQILLEGERTHQIALPATLLHQLIKHGEAWYDLAQRMIRTDVLETPAGPQDAERLWRQWAALGGWRPPAEAQPEPASTPKPPAPTHLEEEVVALKKHLLALEKRIRPEKRRTRTGRGRAPRGSGRRR